MAAAYEHVDVIEVLLWGKRVGAVAKNPESRFYGFRYDPSWIKTGVEPAPIQMPAGTSYTISFPTLDINTFYGLPGMLADALPDSFGNALINAEMARKRVKSDAITPLDRLAYMGSRAMGALEFRPVLNKRRPKPIAIDLSKLIEGARMALEGTFDGDTKTHEAITNIIQVGTSAGGARPKAVIAYNKETREIRSGQLKVDPGYEHWLLKFDGIEASGQLADAKHFGRLEYAYSNMARAAGINYPETMLLEENGRAHFMIKRFDRDGNQRHHIQTLCAMAHLDFNFIGVHDYSQYFETIESLKLGMSALQEAFRRMVFNVFSLNCDDHTKNFSFILKQGGQWELAPAYDVTFAHNPDSIWLKEHLMSVNGKFMKITRADMMDVARWFNIPDARNIIEEVRQAVLKFREYAGDARVPESIINEIQKLIEQKTDILNKHGK